MCWRGRILLRICTVFAFVFLLCLAGFFLWLNRKDQVPMLAVEIPCGALVSHRGADSRHDSPTEFGGGGEGYGGEGANWAPDKHEQFKVWGDETCLLLWRDVSNFWCIFLFPGRLIQFIDLGNGVWAKKKKKKYNILLHLLRWLTGRAAEKKFFPVYRWIFDNDQSLCARCRNFSECKLQKTLDSIQAMDIPRGRERRSSSSSVSDIRTKIQRALCRQQVYDGTKLRPGKGSQNVCHLL